jgi:hypothetical protein
MASHETAFRPLEPDLYPRYVNDDAQEGGYSAQNTAPAKIISLNAYKTLRNLQQAEDVKKIHDLEVLMVARAPSGPRLRVLLFCQPLTQNA